jgi:lipopolysaccharide/colanic/teichoic acid biosynthesis glycosyltransferase
MKDVQIPPAVLGRRAREGARFQRACTLAKLGALRKGGPVVRRALDLVVGCVGLALAAPVFAVAGVLIKASSPGPVFFRQVRVGRHGEPISVYKLRSMYVDAEARLSQLLSRNESVGGVTFKIRHDPRMTPVGRVLRKLSIDEMPQFWNLINGTMTTLGPRPAVPREVAVYSARERRRLEVKPGLTCLWQVSGRSDLSFEQQVALDIEYIDTATPRVDATILAKTIPAVITGRGAY